MLRKIRGFNLIEVLIAMAISALMLPVVGGAFYMLMTIPDNERSELTATNEVRSAADWITWDAIRAADFTYGDEPVYGTFSWEDRTGAIIYSYEVEYRWDNGKLVREETVERWETEQWLLDSQYGLAVARNIESYSDVTFNSSVGEYSHLEVHINSNVGDQSKELEIYVNSRIILIED
ncbi:MAG: prepilin-type N-terminal cleavage/methylation domain-containing protein [Deltaproteobacteria bacterium]|nr:prepilin-type N-terminal cleavage/methylation domain-containing protein [Deltaproteobacteria bacterium]